MPSSLQFVRTAWKVRFAFIILSLNKKSGLHAEFDSFSPRYLNYYTVSIFLLHTYIWASPLTNIASVLPILIVRSFSEQKTWKQLIRR
jgi:hypothetical protein